MLFTVCYSLFIFHCLLFTVCYSLSVIHCLLFTVYFSLIVIHCLLFIVCYSLSVIHCFFLLIVCFSLFSAHHCIMSQLVGEVPVPPHIITIDDEQDVASEEEQVM